MDYEVVSCSDGVEAWDHLRQEDAPELAIIDWVMPGIDGPEICRRLRNSENPGSPYILLQTVKQRKADMIEALQAGADDFLSKPVDREEMQARLRVGQRIIDLQQRRIEEETRYYVQKLEQTVDELQESRTRIVEAQEEVRRAISEELHGSVQTQMMMLYMRLLDIESRVTSSPEEAQQELTQAAKELDDLRENEIRQISHRLHPSIIKLSLCSGIRALGDQYERAIPIELDISYDVEEREPGTGSTIPLNVRLGVYRVAEEAIGNVIKHSEATKVVIRLWMGHDNETLILLVEDNGKGFVVDEARGHSLGLVTIRDYMAAIGGDFQIDSELGVGTKITAYVKLNQD